MKLKIVAAFLVVFAVLSPVKGKNVEGVVKISSSETILTQIEEQNGNVGVECPKFVHADSLKVLPRVSWGYKAQITRRGVVVLTELVPAQDIAELDRKIQARDERRVEVRITPVVRSAHRVAPGNGGTGVVQKTVVPAITGDTAALKKTIADLNETIDRLMKRNAELGARSGENVRNPNDITRIATLEDRAVELQTKISELEEGKRVAIGIKEKDSMEMNALRKESATFAQSLASVNNVREQLLTENVELKKRIEELEQQLSAIQEEAPSHGKVVLVAILAAIGGCAGIYFLVRFVCWFLMKMRNRTNVTLSVSKEKPRGGYWPKKSDDDGKDDY